MNLYLRFLHKIRKVVDREIAKIEGPYVSAVSTVDRRVVGIAITPIKEGDPVILWPKGNIVIPRGETDEDV